MKNKDLLSEYADAMHHLAVDHWSKHPETRIDWCRNVCVQYFFYGELQRVLEKDSRRNAFKSQSEAKFQKLKEDLNTSQSNTQNISVPGSNGMSPSNIRTLDRNYSRTSSKMEQDENVESSDISSVLDNSYDDLQDASKLLAEKCSLQRENSTSDSTVSVVLNDEKQPVESKVEEYLEQLIDSPCSEECLRAMGDGAAEDNLDKNAVYSKYGPTNYTTM